MIINKTRFKQETQTFTYFQIDIYMDSCNTTVKLETPTNTWQPVTIIVSISLSLYLSISWNWGNIVRSWTFQTLWQISWVLTRRNSILCLTHVHWLLQWQCVHWCHPHNMDTNKCHTLTWVCHCHVIWYTRFHFCIF